MKKLLSIVLVIAFVLGMKFFKQHEADGDIHDEAYLFVEALPDFDQHQAFYATAFEVAHDKAFQEAYHPGRRRRAATFDEDRYFEVLFDSMASQAQAGGDADHADMIRTYATLLLTSSG
ncbi:MAG: hypothetical protein AAF089_17505 [Bacteroidota bacterium]